MNRRQAIARVLAAVPALALVDAEFDIERLLWTPKAMVTVPKMPASIGPAFVTAQWILREHVGILQNRLFFAHDVQRVYNQIQSAHGEMIVLARRELAFRERP